MTVGLGGGVGFGASGASPFPLRPPNNRTTAMTRISNARPIPPYFAMSGKPTSPGAAVEVGVSDGGMGVAVRVGVGEGVDVGVTVGVMVGEGLGVGVSVGMDVGVSVGVDVGLGVDVSVEVDVGDGLGVDVSVEVSVGDGVNVGVAVACASGAAEDGSANAPTRRIEASPPRTLIVITLSRRVATMCPPPNPRSDRT